MSQMRPLFSYTIGLWNERKPRIHDDLRHFISELAAHDADFLLYLVDLRPGDPLDFNVTLFKETIGIKSPFGPVGRSRLRMGDHLDQEFSRSAVFPCYDEAKKTAEIRIDAVRGRFRDQIVAYDRLVLPLKTESDAADYALSVIDFEYSLPVGDLAAQTLTGQDRTILRFLVHGHESHDIIRRLRLTAAALERSYARIAEALGARNLFHAVALATARGGEVAPDRPLSQPRPWRQSTSLDELLGRMDEGIVVVDRKGGILRLNRAAEDIMSNGGLHIVRGALRAERPEDSAMLLQLIAEGFDSPNPSQRFAVASRNDRSPLSLLAWRLPLEMTAAHFDGASVGVFITDPERLAVPTPAQLQQQFGLTLTEAMVALEILSGEGVAVAAKRLDMAAGTAKVHLAQIFAKTGTNRQAQLVRLLLGLRHRADMIGDRQR